MVSYHKNSNTKGRKKKTHKRCSTRVEFLVNIKFLKIAAFSCIKPMNYVLRSPYDPPTE